jgi:hypothetical protein
MIREKFLVAGNLFLILSAMPTDPVLAEITAS